MSGAMGVGFGALAAYGGYQVSKEPSNFYISLGKQTLIFSMTLT